MEPRIEDYVQNVLAHISADSTTTARLAEDLREHILVAAENEDIDAVLRRMGDPQALAKDLMDALYEDRAKLIREVVASRAQQRRGYGYEYKSRTRVFGLPLMHINLSQNARGYVAVAKGIIAIGDIALGVLAVGGIAAGGICLGGVGIGFLALAGLALGVFAWGGVAVGIIAFGGFALGVYALGGGAIASRVAVGGYASATVAIGGSAKGLHAFSDFTNDSAATLQQIQDTIVALYPNTPHWLLRLFTYFH